MSVSRETSERLEIYAALLRKWNRAINLVAHSTLSTLEQRHFEDCLQLSELANPTGGQWADLGSGGGLPGLILAMAFSDRPLEFILVESDQRKCAFLRAVIKETDLKNATIVNQRIEAAKSLQATYISARALAPLPRLMPYLKRHLNKDGEAWLMKGENWQSELDDAKKFWQFSCTTFPSQTNPDAAILKIRGVSHA